MPFYAPVGKGLANSARIGPDTGGGWTAVLQNLENALPVSRDSGPTANGGPPVGSGSTPVRLVTSSAGTG